MTEIEQTKLWLEQFVIGLNICPFAKAPFENGLIQIVACQDNDLPLRIKFFDQQIEQMQSSSAEKLSNMLLVFPRAETSFRAFYQFVDRLEDVLLERDLQSTYQLVAFHPDFQFQGSNPNDRENLVNSSPFPMIHLLRHEEVAKAARASANPEDIHLRNASVLEKLTSEELKKRFPWKKNLL